MNNIRAGWHLDEIANLLELQGANPHKIRAFRRAARKLTSLSNPIDECELESIPGIGKTIAEEVRNFLKNGETPLLRTLKEKIPEGVLEILKIPGVDLKTVSRIYRSGEIDSKENLREIIKKREFRKIPGIGAKVEKDIKDFLKQAKEGPPFLLSLVEKEAEKIKNRIESTSSVEKAELTYQVRRGDKLVEEATFLIKTRNPEQVKKEIPLIPLIKDFFSLEDQSFMVTLPGGIPARFFLVAPEKFVVRLVQTTGPELHWENLCDKARESGYELTSEGLNKWGEEVILSKEEDLYEKLGLPFLPPPMRNRFFEEKNLEKVTGIVKSSDIKGDFHLHTNWSDGGSTIEEMAKKAEELGYEYLVVTDHSMALEFAGGMSLAALQEQMEYIDRFNENRGMKYILKGIEADIEMDGSLDVPQRFLEKMDWVIASVHRGLNLPRKEMTRRLKKAVSNPLVQVLGHPTCSLYPEREGINFDIKEVFSQASQSGTAMEINGAPDRRDLNEELIRAALEFDLEFCLGSDAHNDQNMEYIKYALIEAQRAGLTREKIINTRKIEDLPGIKLTRTGGE